MNLFLVIMIVTVWSSVVIAEETAEQSLEETLPDLPSPPSFETPEPAQLSETEQQSAPVTPEPAEVSTASTELPPLPPLPELPPLEEPAVESSAGIVPAAPTEALASVSNTSEGSATALIPVAGEATAAATNSPDTLFSSTPNAATDVPDTVLFEQSEAEEQKAREALEAIEKTKEQKLEEYLAFDAQLDAFFNQAGLVRGTAASDVAAIKKAMVSAAVPGTGVNDAAQGALADQAPALEAVERDMKTLQECEAAVITAVKALSDMVLSLGDVMVQIQTQRIEMTSTTDHAMIVALHGKIKEAAAKIIAAQQSLSAATSEVKAVDDALAKGRDHVAAAQKNTDALTAKNIHIAEVLKTVRASMEAESGESEADDESEGELETDSEDGKKKSEKTSDSWIMSIVKDTVFEAPYCVVSDTVLTIWHASEPVRHAVADGARSLYQGVVAIFDKDSVNTELRAAAHEEPLADPVLERIRIERLQSKQRVAELAQQREIIEMKDTLLDRLEAERVMQLDTKHDIAAELSRAYARHDRELTWVALFKRLVWKTYASTRRLAAFVYNWMNGLDSNAGTSEEGRGVEKDDTL